MLPTICLEVYVDELIAIAEISFGCVAIELFICNIGLGMYVWTISYLNCFKYFGTYFAVCTENIWIYNSKTQD